MRRITVALFTSPLKAGPVQKRLVENGIPAELHHELRLEKLWFVGKAPVERLEVPVDQFEKAYQMLLQWDAAEGMLRDTIRCPECKSLRIDYPQCTHKSVLPNVVIGFLATLGHVNHEFYCQDCHFTWPLEGSRPSVARPHMAPYYFIEGVEQTTLPQRSQPGAEAKAA